MPLIAGAAKAAKAAQTAAGVARTAASVAEKVNEKTGGEANNETSQAANTVADAIDTVAGIKEKLEGDGTLSDEDLKTLISSAGLPDGIPVDWDRCCERVNLNTGETWIDIDEQVLEQLASHVYNHMYRYNEEATQVDPTIDTSETQVGATAQEIEKVNPAAVTEDPATGAKVVDTQKLVMTLAGAMGEMARKVKRLKDQVDNRLNDTEETVFLGKWGDG